MGYKCALVGLSPGVPRDDIVSQAEAGPQAASALVEAWWPGAWTRDPEPTTLEQEALPSEDSFSVGIFGETIVFAAIDPDPITGHPLATAAGRAAWELQIHSVVDLCRYRTPPAYGDRKVEIDAESTPEELRAALEGRLLPFEEPFARGLHADSTEDYELPYHPLELGDSAMLWIFGTYGESPVSDGFIETIQGKDPWDLPMHRFVPAPAPAPKRSFWQRLLGR